MRAVLSWCSPLSRHSTAACARSFSSQLPSITPPTPPPPPPPDHDNAAFTPSVWSAGRYHNPWSSFKEKTLSHRLHDLRRWRGEQRADPYSPASYQHETFPAPFDGMERIDLDTHLPVVTADHQLLSALSSSSPLPSSSSSSSAAVSYTWIGHATSLVQLGPLTVLFDPWFSSRASAWQRVGPRRFRPPACAIAELPPLDAICISHNHFDHLDYHSVRQLSQRMAEQQRRSGRVCRWYVPMGMKDWLRRWTSLPAHLCLEMDWWQQHTQHPLPGSSSPPLPSYSITAVPAQHWTSRLALIDNRWQLWCGFVITASPPAASSSSSSSPLSLYYSGDTGYCPAFSQIGRAFSPISLSVLPIGAYSPRWLLHGAHVAPAEAVQIHCDVGSRQSVAVHWGTVVLSDEMILAPKLELQAECSRRRLRQGEFTTTIHGQTMLLQDGKLTDSSR